MACKVKGDRQELGKFPNADGEQLYLEYGPVNHFPDDFGGNCYYEQDLSGICSLWPVQQTQTPKESRVASDSNHPLVCAWYSTICDSLNKSNALDTLSGFCRDEAGLCILPRRVL